MVHIVTRGKQRLSRDWFANAVLLPHLQPILRRATVVFLIVKYVQRQEGREWSGVLRIFVQQNIRRGPFHLILRHQQCGVDSLFGEQFDQVLLAIVSFSSEKETQACSSACGTFGVERRFVPVLPHPPLLLAAKQLKRRVFSPFYFNFSWTLSWRREEWKLHFRLIRFLWKILQKETNSNLSISPEISQVKMVTKTKQPRAIGRVLAVRPSSGVWVCPLRRQQQRQRDS